MKFDWIALGNLIARLSQLALIWYREVEGNANGEDERRALRAVSIVLNPDTPQTSVDQVVEED